MRILNILFDFKLFLDSHRNIKIKNSGFYPKNWTQLNFYQTHFITIAFQVKLFGEFLLIILFWNDNFVDRKAIWTGGPLETLSIFCEETIFTKNVKNVLKLVRYTTMIKVSHFRYYTDDSFVYFYRNINIFLGIFRKMLSYFSI